MGTGDILLGDNPTMDSSFRQGVGGVAILLFYYLKVTNIQSWTRRILKMKKYVNSSDLIFRNFARINLMFIKTVQKHSVSFNPKRQGTSKFFFCLRLQPPLFNHFIYLLQSHPQNLRKPKQKQTLLINKFCFEKKVS